MNHRLLRHIVATLPLALVFGWLSAQPFQMLHAFDRGAGPVTGTYHDVTNLSASAAVSGSPMAIGHSNESVSNGLVTQMLLDGTPIGMDEYTNTLGHPVVAKCIAAAPNDDVIACFFDPVDQVTDVLRITPGVGVVWGRRLPDIEVQGLYCDSVAAAGAEVIWLTGESMTNNLISIEALSGTGAPLFATEYTLANPNWGYQSSQGFDIHYNSNLNRLTVVGTAVISGSGLTEIVVLRTTPAGGIVWARGYGDPLGVDYYHGKALTPRPGFGASYTIAFEYSNIAAPNRWVGAMNIDVFGLPRWVNAYPGLGFFNGGSYIVEGIDSDGGNRYLLNGFFDSFSNPGTYSTAFSLSLDLPGNPIQFNEYESAGLFAANGTQFWGMEWNPVSSNHVMVGKFRTTAGDPNWPWGADLNSFWAVSSDNIGNANCSQFDSAAVVNLLPQNPNLSHQNNALPTPVPSPLNVAARDTLSATQCAILKTRGVEAETKETELLVRYDLAAEEIKVEILAEVKGAGQLQLLNMQGQILRQSPAIGGVNVFDAQSLASGIYILRYDVPGIATGARKLAIRR